MTDLRTAAQQALDYWESASFGDAVMVEKMDALRAALAEPVQQAEPAQEPVAWATEIIDALQAQYNTEMIKENDSGDALIRLDDAIAAVEDAEKHYTAPPQRKPLTDEEILSVLRLAPLEPSLWPHLKDEAVVGDVQRAVLAIARAVEQAHEIKE